MSARTEDGVIIGLEIHVQLNKLHSKLFCSCGLDYHNAPPNTHTCPVCLGLPGSLPVLNRSAVKSAIKVALAMNCEILPQTQFYRKNYYYPDLPKGFQVTQYDYPLSVSGYLSIEGDEGHGVRRIRINRVHMEEDPGRLVHEGTIDRSKFTLVDYNRAGVPLLEIVTEPDLRSPKEARRFLNKLRNILEYLDVFDGDLDGAIRVDANISLAGGERAEVKNISSYKGAERALSFEIVRQRNVLRRGEVVVQETRHFDELRGVTVSMRKKETEHDYRYFPEPDLVPMRIMDWVPAIKETLPELPEAQRTRFLKDYDITGNHATSLTLDPKLAAFFEDVSAAIDPKLSASWIVDVLKGELNYRDLEIGAFKTADMIEILKLFSDDVVTEKGAIAVIRTILDDGGTPDRIVSEKELAKVKEDVVTSAVDEVLSECADAIADYRRGEAKALNYLVGQVMKKTRGRADPQDARTGLLEKLDSNEP
jgi:aspartyl-tRNA(Asn)/glutamyl-tRNA(Gln) amidotransferase subunit B